MSTLDDSVTPPLSQGVGYGIICGVGALFALGMWWVSRMLGKFQNEVQGSEMFMTAKRSINTGLIASAVVSGWTIAATLLTSTAWTYEFGVSGAYFYGAGASIQIFVFAVSAIELKRRAPGAHTFMEVSKLRYGTTGHWIQIIYSTMYQVINCVNILVGGSEVFEALTGMSPIAGCFLLPVGVVIYTLTGGIKATILTDYTHTIIIYALVLTGLFVVYSSSSLIGSADAMYELLKEAAVRSPVPNNAGGEYLTMSSQSGILLGVVFWCAVFGTTVDVQLYQKAIAANPAATLPGYLIGALAWFCIPFCLATTFGLACRALENTPGFPTYPRPMTATEISSGLSLPYAAIALMGKGGGAFVLLMTFMACTSGFSADLVAVSSVFVYDIYGTYINPNATGGRLVKLSHLACIVWTLCMSVIATGITQTTIGVNYLVTCMGVFTCSCVFPMYSTVLWKAQNKAAIAIAPPLGSITAIASWLGSAYALEGSVTVATTSQTLPLVIGNSVSLISGALYSIILTYAVGSQNFDWEILKAGVRVIDDSDVAGVTEEQLKQQLAVEHLSPQDERALYRGKIIGSLMAIGLCLVFIVLIPLPMYFTYYVFSQHFFRAWVAITFIIAWIATLVILIMPLYQGRHSLKLFLHYISGSRIDALAPKAVPEDLSRDPSLDSEANEKRGGTFMEKRSGTVEVQPAEGKD
ncbi:Sodium:solute symporter family-domain-containing protein [Fomitopsis serialis]|uniref:Sodium:solute symporter family-domain-containing protein n=1 Tax=Fomitopsis serialis TaxID=139415 RepID=UPI002008C276|nr:Sodium:solute symporter family-domain-containing protein [Neoantrodia serialis]KAH9920685.1 Sodium:solute symporter family-domain-containing protein [Neoantrodia serialis]